MSSVLDFRNSPGNGKTPTGSQGFWRLEIVAIQAPTWPVDGYLPGGYICPLGIRFRAFAAAN